jgi:hypothetical protein
MEVKNYNELVDFLDLDNLCVRKISDKVSILSLGLSLLDLQNNESDSLDIVKGAEVLQITAQFYEAPTMKNLANDLALPFDEENSKNKVLTRLLTRLKAKNFIDLKRGEVRFEISLKQCH